LEGNRLCSEIACDGSHCGVLSLERAMPEGNSDPHEHFEGIPVRAQVNDDHAVFAR
jgi:hypothetical protein